MSLKPSFYAVLKVLSRSNSSGTSLEFYKNAIVAQPEKFLDINFNFSFNFTAINHLVLVLAIVVNNNTH